MNNSSLISYMRISPNKSVRKQSRYQYSIDTITPHIMDGNLTVERCGELFSTTKRSASSNYGIESSGKIGMYVPEDYRSWATSSRMNDYRAITIEVANDGGANTGYHVSAEAMVSLVNLCVDICRRYGKTKLVWIADKNTAISYTPASNEMKLTVHRWFAPKACPGDYLMSKMQWLADEVNVRLEETISTSISTPIHTYIPPTPKSSAYSIGKVYTIVASSLAVRKSPTQSSAVIAYRNLTPCAKAHCSRRNGYLDKGTKVTCQQVSVQGDDVWIKIPSGWIAGVFKGKTYVK